MIETESDGKWNYGVKLNECEESMTPSFVVWKANGNQYYQIRYRLQIWRGCFKRVRLHIKTIFF